MLTPRQRAVLVLLHAERRVPTEAAAVLGWSVEAVEAEHAGAASALRRTRLLVAPDADAPPPGPAAGPLGADETYWLRRRLTDDVPDPPYVPRRAADAERRGRRRGRRVLVAGSAVGLALAVLVGAAVLAGPDDASDGGQGPDDPRRLLVDPLPIPDRCNPLPTDGARPDLRLDLDQAPAVWLRFCPTDRPGSLGFAPQVTVVNGVDALVAGWAQPPQQLSCLYQRPGSDGSVRMRLGTADGALHVLDLVVGPCGEVRIDGELVSRDGRTVFAQAVRVLGAQVVGEVDAPAARADVVCPPDPLAPGSADRTTVPDYPRVAGTELALPAITGLVCQYESGGQAGTRLVESFPVDAAQAEQIRAAYLARRPLPAPSCVPDPGRSLYAVVLADATGSLRSFGLDGRECDAVVGPGADRGWAGQWLAESVRYAQSSTQP